MYFAGHGCRDAGGAGVRCLLQGATSLYDPNPDAFFLAHELLQKLLELPARQDAVVLAFFDCCRSKLKLQEQEASGHEALTSIRSCLERS